MNAVDKLAERIVDAMLASKDAEIERLNQWIKEIERDGKRGKKLLDLAVYGGEYKGEHVWRFRPIMGPHQNLLDAIDHLGEA